MEGNTSATVCQPSVCFTVEKIIGVSHGYGNMKTFQVQWSPSWVSSAHLVGCEKLLQEFLNQQQQQQLNNNETSNLDTGPTAKSTSTTEATLKHTGQSIMQGADYSDDGHSGTLYTEPNNCNNVVGDATSFNFPSATDIKLEPTHNDVEECSSLPQPLAPIALEVGLDVQALKEEDQSTDSVMIEDGDEAEVDTSEHTTKQGPEIVLLDEDSDTELDDLDYQHEMQETQNNELNPNTSEYEMEIMTAVMSHQHQQQQDERQQQSHTPHQQQLEQTSGKLRCEICDKPFSNRSRLVIHLEKHTLEKTHECEYCHKSFSRRFNLKIHIRNIHPDIKETDATLVTHDCQLCGEIFMSLDEFLQHYNNHHSNCPDAQKLLRIEKLKNNTW